MSIELVRFLTADRLTNDIWMMAFHRFSSCVFRRRADADVLKTPESVKSLGVACARMKTPIKRMRDRVDMLERMLRDDARRAACRGPKKSLVQKTEDLLLAVRASVHHAARIDCVARILPLPTEISLDIAITAATSSDGT